MSLLNQLMTPTDLYRWNALRVEKLFIRKSNARMINHDPKPQFTYAVNDLEAILYTEDGESDDEGEDKDTLTTDKVLTKLPAEVKWLTVDPGNLLPIRWLKHS
jgi:hypothetical protein